MLFPALDLEMKVPRTNSFAHSIDFSCLRPLFSTIIAALQPLPTTQQALGAENEITEAHCLDQQSNRG